MTSEFNIDAIAKLARLKLSDSEREILKPQMEKILEYIHLLNDLPTDDIEPTSHVLPIENVFREDREQETFPQIRIT